MSMLLAAAGALARRRAVPNITELFSITLDTAANLDSVPTTGWDLLVGKSRVNTTNWVWRDSAQGISNYIRSNTNDAASAFSDYATLLGVGNGVLYRYKSNRRFFSAVAFTHTNGVTSNVSTGLTVPLGLATVKSVNGAGDWFMNHRSLTSGFNLRLNSNTAESNTDAFVSFSGSTLVFSSAAPNGNYVAYVWGHDVADTGVVQAGTYTGNGSVTGPVITLGWRPQWLFVTGKSASINRYIYDNQRSVSNPRKEILYPNLSSVEATDANGQVDFLSTGFQPTTAFQVNVAALTYVYLAIREPS